MYFISFTCICCIVLCVTKSNAWELPPVELDNHAKDLIPIKERIFVREFRFEGNTVISDQALAARIQEYEYQWITSEELEGIRNRLSLSYLEKGYINSGALLEEQTFKDGVVIFRIVEGELTEIVIKSKGKRRLRDPYIKRQLNARVKSPLNMGDLRDSLQLLRQDPNIRRINAEIKPTGIHGKSMLELNLEERYPLHATIGVDNYRSASIGAERVNAYISHQNLFGYSDAFNLRYGLTQGGWDHPEFNEFGDLSASYAFPLNRYGTELEMGTSKTDNTIIEEPFEDLDIKSEFESYSLKISHPLYRTLFHELNILVEGEYKESQTFVGSEPFSLFLGNREGQSVISVLRLGLDGIIRTKQQVLAARSVFSFGQDLFGATINEGNIPDSEFISWQGQMQYVRRLGESDNRIIARVNAQLANEALLSLEQFSLGGISSVRGYRENQFVRDNGVAGGVELRIGLLRDKLGLNALEFVPFFDYGEAWSSTGNTASSETLKSAGLGLIFNIASRFNAQLYWGHGFREFEVSERDLQDEGLHFSLSYRLL